MPLTQAQRNRIAASKAAAQARRAAKVRTARGVAQRYIRSMLPHSELKGMDTDIAISAGSVLATTNDNGASFVLNLIRTGSASYNRIGRKIALHSLRLRGQAFLNYTDTTTSGDLVGNQLRMVVVYDQLPGGTIPTFDSIFGHTVQAGTESTDFLDPPKYDGMERYRVLYDKVISISPQTTNASGGSSDLVVAMTHFDKYISLKGLNSAYSGESSPQTIADIAAGAVYVYFRGYLNETSTRWQIGPYSVARIRYTDM